MFGKIGWRCCRKFDQNHSKCTKNVESGLIQGWSKSDKFQLGENPNGENQNASDYAAALQYVENKKVENQNATEYEAALQYGGLLADFVLLSNGGSSATEWKHCISYIWFDHDGGGGDHDVPVVAETDGKTFWKTFSISEHS